MKNILGLKAKAGIIAALLENSVEVQNNKNPSPENVREILANSVHLECFSIADIENKQAEIKKISEDITNKIDSLAQGAVADITQVAEDLSKKINDLNSQDLFLMDTSEAVITEVRDLFMQVFNIDLCYSAIYAQDKKYVEQYKFPNELINCYVDNIELFFDIIEDVQRLFDCYDDELGWERPEKLAALAVPCRLLEEYRMVSGDGDIFTEGEVKEIVGAIIALEEEQNEPAVYLGGAYGESYSAGEAKDSEKEVIYLIAKDDQGEIIVKISIELYAEMIVKKDGEKDKEVRLNDKFEGDGTLIPVIEVGKNKFEKLWIEGCEKPFDVAFGDTIVGFNFRDLISVQKENKKLYIKDNVEKRIDLKVSWEKL